MEEDDRQCKERRHSEHPDDTCPPPPRFEILLISLAEVGLVATPTVEGFDGWPDQDTSRIDVRSPGT